MCYLRCGAGAGKGEGAIDRFSYCKDRPLSRKLQDEDLTTCHDWVLVRNIYVQIVLYGDSSVSEFVGPACQV